VLYDRVLYDSRVLYKVEGSGDGSFVYKFVPSSRDFLPVSCVLGAVLMSCILTYIYTEQGKRFIL